MYLVFFIVGAGFIILSLIMGAFADVEFGPASILQPKLVAIFLTVTGGVGIVLSRSDSVFLSAGIAVLTISVLSGLAVAGLMHRLVIIPLRRAQNTSTFDKQATIGVAATVISPIPQNGYGKIRYSISGSTVTSPAKSEDGGEIKNGATVDIVYIEGNTYFVRRQLNPN